ncbi:MAG: phosphotransferase [Anaerolineales bacterium]|nr:phosphotransferase [Anaerolineales bacterium]
MIEPTEATWAQIAAFLWPGSRFIRTWPLSGGLSARMQALEGAVDGAAPQQVVVRWYGSGSGLDGAALGREYRLLRALHAAGLSVPEPLGLDVSGSRLPAPYLAMALVPGEMCFKPADLPSHIDQLATQLARIHQLDTTSLGFLPRSPGCAELARPAPATDPAFAAPAIWQRLQATAPLPTSNRPVLQHGDFWPGNSLWVDGQLSAIIDWEDAQLGEPLQDLAQSRAEISWIFGPASLAQFTQTYQALQPLDYSALPYWDLCAALRMLRLAGNDLAGMAAYFHAYNRPNITAASIKRDLLAFIAGAQTSLI